MSRTILLSLIAAASASAIALSAPAAADAQTQARSGTVKYADLDLSSAAGARSMIQRIQSKARGLCSPEPATNHWAEYKDYRRCLTDAESGAVHRLNAPVVTAFYEGHGESVMLAQAASR